jgi:hypothetical protein
MKNIKCLIITHGFFGDIAFSTSIAEKLKKSGEFNTVDYLIGYPQMESLLRNDPYIDNVIVSEYPSAIPINRTIIEESYDKVIKLKPLSFIEPPACEYQRLSGIENISPEYKIYTAPEYDALAKQYLNDNFENSKKTLAIMLNWESKSYLFTKSQYEAGIDTPNLGYGGKHRNIQSIVNELSKHYNLYGVGYPQDVSQIQTSKIEDTDIKSLLFECSIIKNCDAFIGTEGGLCNLAAGIGTRTIITGDFVHQLYGWNGVIKKIKEPKLGPIHYFKDKDHIELDPYLTDEEVLLHIKEYLK